MKNLLTTISGYVLAVVILLWFKGCNNSEPATITIPKVKGKFEAVKPVHDTIVLTKIVKGKVDKSEIDKLKKEYNFTQQEISEMTNEIEHLVNFANNLAFENDSIKAIIKDYATVKEFKQNFDDQNLKADVSGIVFKNEVQRLKLDYTIKEQKIKVPEKKFSLLAGVEVGNTKELNDFSAKANIGFQNKKGSIIHVGIDTNERFYVGYTIEVFSIKK
jgi:regulator of replication initiation timing